MKKKITEVDSLASLDDVTAFFVNDGEDIKQIKSDKLKPPERIFIATYGETSYEEILENYNNGEEIILKVPENAIDDLKYRVFATLTRIDGGAGKYNFTFVCIENNKEHHFLMEGVSEEKWSNYSITLADANQVEKDIANVKSGLENKFLSEISYSNSRITKNTTELARIDSELSEAVKTLVDNINTTNDDLERYKANNTSELSIIRGQLIEPLESKVLTLNANDSDIYDRLKNINELIPILDYKEIEPNEKFYIDREGIYLFAGADYNMNFYSCDATGNYNLVGTENNLIIALFVSKLHSDDMWMRCFYGKTYKRLGIATAESQNTIISKYSNLQSYIQNGDGSNKAVVYYLRPQG